MKISKKIVTLNLITILFLSTSTYVKPIQKKLSFMPVKSGELGSAGGFLNKVFLQNLRELFDPSLFIETGTYIGDSSAIAAVIFEQVYTIELSRHSMNRLVSAL